MNDELRGHALMTDELRASLPALYATEDVPTGEKVVQVKFFSPYSGWTWYAVEFDGEDRFFGLVDGLEREWGYFHLSELEAVMFRDIVPAVERDLYFEPTAIKDLD